MTLKTGWSDVRANIKKNSTHFFFFSTADRPDEARKKSGVRSDQGGESYP